MERELPARRRAHLALAAAATLAALPAPPAAAADRAAAPDRAPAARALAPRPPSVDVPLPPPPPGTRLERRGATLGVAVGAWAAFKTGSSLALHADYGFVRTPPGWGRLELEVRLGVSVARPSDNTSLSRIVLSPVTFTPVQMQTGTETTRTWLVEAVPFGRVRLPLTPKFAVFADAGLGLAQTFERYEREETFVGHTTTTRNVTGLALRLAGGASYEATERLRVLFLPLALSFQVGPGYGGYAPSLGVAYHL